MNQIYYIFKVLKTLSKASCKISEGEMKQLIFQNNINISKTDYINIIKGKTAELFSAACKSGAIISTNDSDEIIALEKFGKELGISYQLVDDALDYQSENKNFDKSNFKISDVIEKPNTKDAPSNNAVIGRYILPKKIFNYLKNQKKGKGDEIHITDAIRRMILDQYLFIGHKFRGNYLDCGTMNGYIKSGIVISKLWKFVL